MVEGYTASEIAKLTNMTRGSVLSMLHRTRKKLQAAIDEGNHDSNGKQSKSKDQKQDNPEAQPNPDHYATDESANVGAVVVPLHGRREKNEAT